MPARTKPNPMQKSEEESVGGTRKFYGTQVCNPADGALGHLDVSFPDCPTTESVAYVLTTEWHSTVPNSEIH